MSKQNSENRKIRSQNGIDSIAQQPASGGGKAIAFARELAAAQQVVPSNPSRIKALHARLLHSSFIRAGFVPFLRRIGKQLFKRRGRRRKLDIVEIQQLGEKRFVAILRVGKQKFLIGGAATSVSLLAELDALRAPTLASRSRGKESA